MSMPPDPQGLPDRLPGETPIEYHQRVQAMRSDYVPVRTRTEIVAEQTHNKTKRIVEACEASGEPIFVLRAKDVISNMAIAEYRDMLDKYVPNNTKLHGQIGEILDQFLAWQQENMDKVRYPD